MLYSTGTKHKSQVAKQEMISSVLHRDLNSIEICSSTWIATCVNFSKYMV